MLFIVRINSATPPLLSRLFDCSPEVIRTWSNPGRFVTGEEFVAAGLAKMIDLFSGDVWKQMAK